MDCICVWFLAIAVRLDLTNCRKFPAYLRKFANCWRYGNHAHSYESSVSYRVVVGVSESLTTEAMMAPVSTGILPHSLPEWAFRARPGLWRNCLCPKVARIAEQKFGSR